MRREAAEAPSAVRRQLAANRSAMQELARRLREQPPGAIVTCARGSSDHAATYAKYLIETRTGVITSSAAPSVASVYRARAGMRGIVCLAISQSGASPDLLCAVEAARAAGAITVALVNAAQSPLASLVEHAIPLHAGPELSVAATKSFLASLVAVAHLVAAWTDDAAAMAGLEALPDAMERAWMLDWSAAVPRLRGVGSMYVLGRGLGLGLAQESALKLKETCGIHAEGISAAEVRHGPMALVRAGFPALVYGQDDETLAGVEAVAADLVARGATVTVAGLRCRDALELPTLPCEPCLAPILLCQTFYGLADAVSIARGLDPDRPPHLSKVTETV
jgi:glucosamine--fructose-6-phosphate aminotransferase (isomerizing)